MTSPPSPVWPPPIGQLAALIGGSSPADAELRQMAYDAAVAFAESLDHVRAVLDAEPPGVPDGGVRWGTVLLAARYVMRRHTLSGIASTEGGMAYVAKSDPDVARALRLGRPRVG